LTLGFIGQLKPAPSHLMTLKSINLPPEIAIQTLPLSQAETNFFDNPANPLVQKVRFQSQNLSGSMLIVASDTWHSHHPPELCFVGSGFKVDNMNSTLINKSIHARWLSLQNGELSATYWFQSSEETTDNFISRIWEDITHSDKTWVLVSVLFDDSLNPDDGDLQQFAGTIYQTIDFNLNS
jgi:exosortase O